MMELDTSIKLPPLMAGKHESAKGGLCAMEMVAFMERLPHSDSPPCTCPVIAAFVRGVNDLLPDERRNELLPYLSRLVGTVAPEYERERAEYLAWAAITIFAPAALRTAKLFDHADALANFDKSLGLNKAAARAASAANATNAAWAASVASAAWAANAASVARVASAANAANAARTARAAWAASVASAASVAVGALHDDCFRVLDGLLLIGPQSSGFTQPERVKELAYLVKA